MKMLGTCPNMAHKSGIGAVSALKSILAKSLAETDY
jgi:hypothetical protein